MIAIIDAELAEGKLQRHPNLACMKISSYYKSQEIDVTLKTDYNNLQDFEKVYISKVFTKTKTDNHILRRPNVIHGGTGFFYDKASNLPTDIEHHMPDYTLYNDYVQEQLNQGVKPSALKVFTDYSIGFLTQGCFRKCSFCVNKKYNRCTAHSPLNEFYDPSRKKIMLLDDNFLAYPKWRNLLDELKSTGKPFVFKQGVDIRLITPDFIQSINSAKYDGELYFAFDDVNDEALIEAKLSMFREYSRKSLRMYLLCAYDRDNVYDTNFWLKDIKNIFKRLEVLGKYKVLPYLMRYEKYESSPFHGIYKNLATYCNVGGLYKVSSFSDFCKNQLKNSKNKAKPCSRWRYYTEFIKNYPHFEVVFNKHNWRLHKSRLF